MRMFDVVIAGAGPAGCIAGITLARQGVRVLMVDRARFPRPKMCGDSLNPGTIGLFARMGLSGFPEHRAVVTDGMVVTGEGGARIEATYPATARGRFIERTHLDLWLLDHAIAAGVEYQGETRVTGAVVVPGGEGDEIAGLNVVRSTKRRETLPARMTIAADGRRSTLAFGLGLARHPARPRRWAIGGYFCGVTNLSSFGEMHVRAGRYFGVAPLPGGVVNACLVTSELTALRTHRELDMILTREIARDRMLGPRFSTARLIGRAAALGPLAVDAQAAGMPGLLLAGDAGGFIDPITGDGLYFATRGGELAAQAALLALSDRTPSPHIWLAAQRRREFRFKHRFNRSLRSVMSVPPLITAASWAARSLPAPIHWIVKTAADMAGDEAATGSVETPIG